MSAKKIFENYTKSCFHKCFVIKSETNILFVSLIQLKIYLLFMIPNKYFVCVFFVNIEALSHNLSSSKYLQILINK